MGENLGAIFTLLEDHKDLCDQYLLEEYLEMVEDDETEVRGPSLKHLKHLGKFSSDCFSEKGIPVLKRLLEKRDQFTDEFVQELAHILYSV